MDQKNKKPDLKKIFNLNNILSKLINWAAYVVAFISCAVLLYLSLIQSFDFNLDWRTIGIFSIVVVALVWINWNTFYKRHYEKTMANDIDQHDIGKYSIHGRYYAAIKDYTDNELQECINKYNDDYKKKWLHWVEYYTGVPIKTQTVKEIDENGKDILDENGKPKLKVIKGIKDLPYKGFKHKIIMWKIKHHKYPQSGYRTSTEVSSLLSFQDTDLSKKNLKRDKEYYRHKSLSKLIFTFLSVCLGASLAPQLINGEYAAAIFKMVIALGSLLGAVIGGGLSGIQGARLKLSIVEDVCFDLERWANKKPLVAPYKVAEAKTIENKEEQTFMNLDELDPNIKAAKAAEKYFSSPNLQK